MKQHDPDAVTRVERETWNRSAPVYLDNAAKLTVHAVDRLIASAGLAPGSRALEIGCGPGHITKRLADAGATATGVDLAPEMIAVARRLYPGLDFHEANAESLPFGDAEFDGVLVNFAIHHFARPAKACQEIHRVLKPRGRFVFAGPIEPVSFAAFIDALSAHHTLDGLAHGPIYLGATREDYENLVKGAGFRDFDVSVRTIVLHLENLAPLIETVWKMCDLSKLPTETQDKIRAATHKNAAPYRTEQGYAFPDRVVIGVATK